ncbi:MAG TPA: hypothetical protein VII06_08115 [Chloroflexota bacterium]|jgi:hypothetical protein
MIELPPGITLEDALRLVGRDLDERGVPYVEIRIAPLGITVETAEPYSHQAYSWGYLGNRLHSARERGCSPPDATQLSDLLALTRWAVLLSLVGQILERRQRLRSYLIEAEVATPSAPTVCQVRVSAAGEPMLGTDEVQEQLLRARARATAAPAAIPPPPPRRPWWMFWRRG